MTTLKFRNLKNLQGFSIIELMIALVLGLLLSTGITKVFITTKDTYNLSENMARMQESARFAMQMLKQDVRMGGFLPCRINDGNFVSSINGAPGVFDFLDSSIVGYDDSDPNPFPAPFPAVGTSASNRVADTDAIVILRGSDSGILGVTNHNPSSAVIRVNAPHTFEPDDIAMICDGNNAAVFQITNANQSNQTLVHNTGGGASIGNCTKSLGGQGNCLFPDKIIDHSFGTEAQVVRFHSVGYYIGVSASGDSSSLYRTRLSAGAFGAPEELLSGIENMQLLYGLDVSGGVEPERYVTANDVSDWKDVVSVKIGILAHTPDPVNKINDTKTYMVAGTEISDTAPGLTHAGDRRLRSVFNTIVKIRNRGLN